MSILISIKHKEQSNYITKKPNAQMQTKMVQHTQLVEPTTINYNQEVKRT
jgi:hypothetical protein